ncbi:MAG: hypothetical protein IJX08_04810 [Clostridia bacterium]|nr:hypothetical protein [Clostridia bacterium]
MEQVIVIALIMLLGIALVLGIVIPIFKNHSNVSDGIVNYDAMMRKFVYKVPFSKQEILRILQEHRDVDELSCEFQMERSVVKISEYYSNREYFFTVQECDGYSILRLDQVSSMSMQGHVPYKLNPFMVEKLNAQLLPFDQYGA